MIVKEKLSDFKELFEQAQKLIEDVKADSYEPYKNHYQAREILEILEKEIEKAICQLENDQKEDKLILQAILGYVQKDIGKISMFVDETNVAESYFEKSLQLLEPEKHDTKTILCYVDVLNQFGILFSKLSDVEKSKKYLLNAEEAVNEFKELSKDPLTIFDIFGTEDEIEKGKGNESLEKIITLTYFYLAQVYGQLGDLETSAKYCHLTLKRQLELKDYDPIEWALNSATLSQFYFGKNMLKQSRHLLAASSFMIANYAADLEQKEMSEDQRAAENERLKHRTADIDLCFSKYCIYILKTSIQRLLQEEEEDSTSLALFQLNDSCEKFPLELDFYERQVTDTYILTFDDAKITFLNAQSYLNKAKEYYSLENEASQYARIIQDYASLYKHLAFFEDDASTQAKLHKRRADQLEAVKKELNPTFYMNICRELIFELGLTYSDMLDIKCDKLKFEEVNPYALNKINTLCHKSIEKFQEFINTYKDKKTNEIPKTLDIDDYQAIACAHFNLGRLFYKIITPDKRMQLEWTQKSLNDYKIFIDYCEQYKEVAERMKGEKGVTQSMIELLPHKIKKLMDEISQ
ncbi:hypothetical protein PVAND_006867 [Polypedilum vanderplanki]|uniref:KIF-binding protein n=1 Tax=Polypedilum vanderplanki TaxID=319348 RepID=A0A9J6C5H6_POLVA|nr:hypothetical protein PVAND_006867 [Polypedilum vanderplanki]